MGNCLRVVEEGELIAKDVQFLIKSILIKLGIITWEKIIFFEIEDTVF